MAFFRSHAANIDVARAFRDNRQLQQFVLTDVTPTGRKLGTGSFGSVEEVTYQQIIYAGKRIHEALLDVENEGVPEMIQKYQQECQLMSSLRHPNITQFIGLCFLPGTQLPLLIMERLETSLDDLLEHMPNIPLSLKRSILENVASGLLYLHKRNPPVIHRDLTSKNVLLTSSLVAKITDMGNSRIADMRPGQMVRTLSTLPGTLVYMPPEALDDSHHYGPSMDIFSFGHLALFTITQKFPGDLLPSTYVNTDKPEEIRGRSELERRRRYIGFLEAMINLHHPALVELVKECLLNAPDRRPTTDNLLTRLQGMREEVEGEYGNPVKLDMARVKLAKEVKLKDRQLTQQQERHEAVLRGKTRELEEKTRELEDKTRELEDLTRETKRQEDELAKCELRMHPYREERNLEREMVKILQQTKQSASATEIEANNVHLAEKDQEFARKSEENPRQREQIQQLQEEIQELHLSKEIEISRLREELSKCQGLLQEGAKVDASPKAETKKKLELLFEDDDDDDLAWLS